MKLKNIMTNAMYLRLVNIKAAFTVICCNCKHVNGECAEFAKAGTCNQMRKDINEVLVFHTGEYEFAVSRQALAKALEMNNENAENPWAGKTVDAVLEDCGLTPYGEENAEASIVMELLPSDAIITTIDWTELN